MSDKLKEANEAYGRLLSFGYPEEISPMDAWRKPIMELITEHEKKLGDEHPEGGSPDEQIAIQVVEIAIAKLSPSVDDIIVFWLPAELSHSKVNQIASSFGNVIGDRFRFMVLVRNAIDIEIISGKQSKGGVLLPS